MSRRATTPGATRDATRHIPIAPRNSALATEIGTARRTATKRQIRIHDLGLDMVETLDSLHPDYEAREIASDMAHQCGDDE